MSAIVQDVRAMRAVAQFFTIIYLTFICMHFGPTDRLRRWGKRTWWDYFRLGLVLPTRVEPRGEPKEDNRPSLALAYSRLARQPAQVGPAWSRE